MSALCVVYRQIGGPMSPEGRVIHYLLLHHVRQVHTELSEVLDRELTNGEVAITTSRHKAQTHRFSRYNTIIRFNTGNG